jgi:hypothetical protein
MPWETLMVTPLRGFPQYYYIVIIISLSNLQYLFQKREALFWQDSHSFVDSQSCPLTGMVSSMSTFSYKQ